MSKSRRALRGKRAGLAISIAGTVLIALAVGVAPGLAHKPEGAYINGPYHPSYLNVHYWFDDDFPGPPCNRPCRPNSKKEAIIRGAEAWNALDQGLKFKAHTEEEIAVSDWYGYCEDPNESNQYDSTDGPIDERDGNPMGILFWGDIPAELIKPGTVNIGAINKTCEREFTPGQEPQLWTFKQMYDDDPNWYSGRGRELEWYQTDLQSIAAHEFGHASGWRLHFDRTDASDDDVPGKTHCQMTHEKRWTMCAKARQGKAWWRTLNKHDKHTFGNRY